MALNGFAIEWTKALKHYPTCDLEAMLGTRTAWVELLKSEGLDCKSVGSSYMLALEDIADITKELESRL